VAKAKKTEKKPTKKLTHINAAGDAHMVGISKKVDTERRAVAECVVMMQVETAKLLRSGDMPKGDALACARIAGIQGAKRTPELIPLCHPIRVTGVEVEIIVGTDRATIRTAVTAFDRTGVEMEALTAASTAALALYDMCKAVDKSMRIDGLRVLSKTGGKSDFTAV